MDCTEIKLSKGIDLISYFLISYCVCHIHQDVSGSGISHNAGTREHFNVKPQKDFESFLCRTATYYAVNENNSMEIYWNRYTQCFHRCPGMSVPVIISLFVCLLFLSHYSSFSTLSKNRHRHFFLFTY